MPRRDILNYEYSVLDYYEQYRPDSDDKRRLYGVEIEVEVINGDDDDYDDRHRIARRIPTSLPVLTKGDGSLDNGFEIVSVPTLRQHQKTIWRDVLAQIDGHVEAWNTRTCGMHVHLNRKSLSSFQLAKVIYFCNHVKHNVFLAKLSGRNPNTYCLKKVTRLNGDAINARVNGNKYNIVHIGAQNGRTVEFRMFRGTTSLERIGANLDIVDALINWVGTIPWTLLNETEAQKSLAQYILAQGKEYRDAKSAFEPLLKKAIA